MHRWQGRLLANPHVEPDQKLVLWVLYTRSSRSRGRHNNGWMRVLLSRLAAQVGMSRDAVECILSELSQAGVIRRTLVPASKEPGRSVPWLMICLTDEIDAPERLILKRPRKHGDDQATTEELPS